MLRKALSFVTLFAAIGLIAATQAPSSAQTVAYTYAGTTVSQYSNPTSCTVYTFAYNSFSAGSGYVTLNTPTVSFFGIANLVSLTGNNRGYIHAYGYLDNGYYGECTLQLDGNSTAIWVNLSTWSAGGGGSTIFQTAGPDPVPSAWGSISIY